jgi:molecular chaperone DnaK (HSP70)
VLSEVLGGRPLDRHLDSDEAAVLGASLFAANLSTSFRLKKFGMTDGAMFGVTFKVGGRRGAAVRGSQGAAARGGALLAEGEG